MPTSNKLNYLLETKNLIKRAIEKLTKKTIPENTTFREYSELFNDITVVDNQEKVITINSNGTTEITPDADKTGLDKVTVTTAIPLEDNKSQTITGNGTITITPTAGNTAMKKVTVTTNVNTVKNQNKTQSITGNGTVTVKPDSGYTGMGQVTINTNVNRYNGPTAITNLMSEVSGGSINKTITWTIPANKNVMIVLVNVNKGAGSAVCKVNNTAVGATSVYDNSSDGIRTQIWRWLISANSANRTLSLTGESGAGRMCSAFAIY